MAKLIGIALGAGVTSALLFIVATTASLAGLVLAYLAPLPLMIAGLGFTHAAGGLAALVAGGTVGVALGPGPAAFFVVALGLPAWYLAKLALLGRPAAAAAPGTPAVEWFPVSRILLRLAGLASLPVLIACLVVVAHYGGYRAAVAVAASRFAAAFGRDALPGDVGFARLVEVLPVAMAASSTVMLAFNFWLAARMVAFSDRLARPWPNLPDAVRLPRTAAAALALLLAACLLPGMLGLAARVPAAALGMVFAFEGLAAAHVLTRGLVARRAILAAVYLTVVFLTPWPLLALCLLGCIDCLTALRGGTGFKITKT